jgi:hypothetical protein
MNITRSLALSSIIVWGVLQTTQLLAAGDVTPENADGFLVLDDKCRLPIKEAVYVPTSEGCRWFSLDHGFKLEKVRSAVTIVFRANNMEGKYTTVTIRTIKDKVSTANLTFNQLLHYPPNTPFFPGLLFVGVVDNRGPSEWVRDIIIHMDN